MATRPSRAQLQGATVTYRVDWVLGTDRLLGHCRCGAQRESDDPIELWQWLTAHPEGHGDREPSPQPEPARPAVRTSARHLVGAQPG
jgi:hypothetical protein